ncbi:MAG: aminotransferase class I/II-fold pyridoxal phosphate-dependent enzyme [Polyangiaceae bacterium]
MSWLHDKTTEILGRVDKAKRLKAYPYFRPFENIGPRVGVGDGSYINYTSNDYLGLSQDKRLIEAACAGTRHFGTGLGSARPQATTVRHNLLEERLAHWLGYGGCTVFTTGYQFIVGTMQAFLDDETTVVLDKLSHAAIIDGALLAKGQSEDLEIRFFKHNDVANLDKTLAGAANPKKMVVIEGLYSVDGDMAPLADMIAVAKKHGAVVMLDDAHGLGALGPTGRGVCEMNKVMGQVDLLIGTFSKSFGTVGGFLCADKTLVDYVKVSARSFVFSASLPLAQVEAALVALDIIEHDTTLMKRLQDNGKRFREGLLSLGFNLGDSNTHITPIFLNDEELTMRFAAYLFHGAGVIMIPFVSPGVPKGKERLRCNVTAMHTEAQMGYTLEALAEIGKMLGVLQSSTSTHASKLSRIKWFLQHELEGVRNAGLPFVRREVTAQSRRLVNKVLGRPDIVEPTE